MFFFGFLANSILMTAPPKLVESLQKPASSWRTTTAYSSVTVHSAPLRERSFRAAP